MRSAPHSTLPPSLSPSPRALLLSISLSSLMSPFKALPRPMIFLHFPLQWPCLSVCWVALENTVFTVFCNNYSTNFSLSVPICLSSSYLLSPWFLSFIFKSFKCVYLLWKDIHNIKFTILLFLSVQFCGIKYIDIFVQHRHVSPFN